MKGHWGSNNPVFRYIAAGTPGRWRVAGCGRRSVVNACSNSAKDKAKKKDKQTKRTWKDRKDKNNKLRA